MVVGVAYHLKLYLLPALERLLDQYLWCKGEGRLGHFAERLLVGTDARTQSAEGVGRTYHHGERELTGSLQGIGHVLHGTAAGREQVYLVELLDKEVAVFGVHNGFHARAEHLHAILPEHAAAIEFGAAVEGRLSAESQQDAVGAFFLDDFGHEVGGDGLEVHLVGDTFRGLDGGDVGIDEHRVDALFPECFQRLRTRIVEFAGLSDFQCARSEYEHFAWFLGHCGVMV